MTAGDGPTLTDKAKKQAEEREKRRAEALRANLRRRKAQSRARDDQAETPAAKPDGEQSADAENPSS